MDERTIEDIKSRTDLVELVSSYGIQVKSMGGSAKACCPFHHEKTPSFHINTAKGFYHCFGCGESGDAIKFVQKQEGLTFIEAVRRLADRCGVKIEEERVDPAAALRKRLYALMAELAAFYRRCLLKTREAKIARDYLDKRALNEETGEKWVIGYAPNGVGTILKWAEKYGYTASELEAAGVIKAANRSGERPYHRFSGRLVFSICDKQGRVVAFSGRQLVEQKNSGKYVNSPETPIFTKGRVLFGFDKAAAGIAKTRTVLVCEGQIDCIRLHSAGFTNAVAGQGTAFTDEHVRMLRRVADSAVLVYDDDAAGHKATIKSAGMLLAAEMPVMVVSLPGGEDPDSFLRNHGAEEFRRLVERAESIIAFQVRVERAKERDAESIDAVNRVVKAVLSTIAQSTSAVLKAAMLAEAARLLKLPLAALSEELAKFKAAPLPRHHQVSDEAGAIEETPPPASAMAAEGEDAGEIVAPSRLEKALMQFLMANEKNRKLDGMVGEFLPPVMFGHDFTRRYVERWRLECGGEVEDAFAGFAAALSPREREWFDAVVCDAGLSSVSDLKPEEIFQDFARQLWVAYLKRLRGDLPARGDAEAELKRMRLSMDIKHLKLSNWSEAVKLIQSWIAP